MTKHQRQSLAFFADFFEAGALQEAAGRFRTTFAAGRLTGVAAAGFFFTSGSCVGNHQQTLMKEKHLEYQQSDKYHL